MPFPRRLLNEGEEVSLDLRPHWWYFANHILTGVPLLVILVIRFKTHGSVHSVLLVVWAVLALVWAVWLGLQYLNWTFTHFVVTSTRVIFRTGVLAKHGVEIPLDRIANINFNQTIWERVIGAGDLEIESAGKDGQSKFDDVLASRRRAAGALPADGARTRRRARGLDRRSPPRPPRRRAGPAPTVPEQLQQLADLRDRGVITAEEFEAKKAQLLERM